MFVLCIFLLLGQCRAMRKNNVSNVQMILKSQRLAGSVSIVGWIYATLVKIAILKSKCLKVGNLSPELYHYIMNGSP